MSTSSAAPAQTFDDDAAANFAERIATMLDAGATAVMLSIGHRTGLFDVLAALPPADSARIAAQAGLAERYVREWLAVMVVSGVVRHAPARRHYWLPAEHVACLTRQASPGNLAVYGQHVALLGAVQDAVIDCFRSGAGLRYADYPCFHEVMAEDSGQTVTAGLFEHILPLAGGVEARLQAGIDVLDAGCGRGATLLALAARYPRSRFTGYDLCADAIAHARQAAAAGGLDNLCFETRDLSDFGAVRCFDLITSFDAVHDQRDPQALIASLYRALREDGVYLMQDIGGSAQLENNLEFPMAALLYAISCAHCTPVSLAQGGAGLGTMWGWETAEAMLHEAGFSAVQRHLLAHDPMNVWFVSRKHARP